MNTGRPNTAISIPNILTLMRLLMAPLFVILLLHDRLTAALIIFSLAGISDGLDGFIARWFNQQTVLGAYLDPVADKVLLVSAFICLALLGIIPDWLTVIVLSREVIIVLGIAILTLTEKKYRVRPSLVSKCTTAVQIAMVIVSLVLPNIPRLQMMQHILLWTTAALTMISGFHYLYIGMNMLQQVEEDS